ncbi:hypothetical protein cyc_04387 [Cyclospora cayetanensis]|uniref:F-box domain-containing protein n=1 Tax=Cyclospora cayetanensis TaxID=88456 RepID=A0A1D3CSK2_9EIME|nr:hypothetical protein cyc_04387 [Cyclospora cayetanensis]
MQRPAPYGGATAAHGSPESQETSPYTFDSRLHEDFPPGFPRPQRSATNPVDSRGTGSRSLKRNLARMSPRNMPAAGMPSGSRRTQGEWLQSRRRWQAAAASGLGAYGASPTERPSSNERLFRPSQRSSLRQHGASTSANDPVGGLQDPSGFAVPSTLPPSLHPPSDGENMLSQQFLQHEQQCAVLSCAEAPSDIRSRRVTAAKDTRFGVWRAEEQPAEHMQCCHQWAPRQADCQVSDQFNKQQPPRITELAAGKPSSQNALETWEFCQSLRSSDAPRAGFSKPLAVSRCTASKRDMIHNSSFVNSRGAISEDEETLRGLGVQLSPRELQFFRKQPSLRLKEQRLHVQKTAKGWKDTDPRRASVSHLPATCSGYECEEVNVHGERADDARMRQKAAHGWSIPSWMRAYGVSNTLRRYSLPAGSHNRLDVPTAKGQGPSNEAGLSIRDSSRCGCQCCRLRAANSGVEALDASCCCCPCCCSWRVGLGDSYGDKKGQQEIYALGEPAGAVDTEYQCARCGKLQDASLRVSAQAEPNAQIPLCQRAPDLDGPASLCDACATYMACERERSAPVAAADLNSLEHPYGKGTADQLKLQPDLVNTQAYPRGPRQPPRNRQPPIAEGGGRARSATHDAPTAVPEVSEQAGKAVISRDPRLLKWTAQMRWSTAHGTRAMASSTRSRLLKQNKALGVPPPRTMVWESPRIVSKICRFLSLSKLLVVRRCSKVWLQAAQYRMRNILYKSLYMLLHQHPGSPGYQQEEVDGQHCPLSAEALIQLLDLEESEVEAVKAGNLPPAHPPEAETPRMKDVAASIRKAVAEMNPVSRKGASGQQFKTDKVLPASGKQAINAAEPTAAVRGSRQSLCLERSLQDRELRERMLLDAHVARHQAKEEACLSLLGKQNQLERAITFGYDEAAGPTVSPLASGVYKSISSPAEPATFRRVRHSFLKLWNYDDEAFRQALVGATSTAYPAWLFDVSALLLRAIFQVCCNALSAPPLKDLIKLFSPKSRSSSTVDVPSRSDSYLWAKMARISGYSMHLVADQTWPPVRNPMIRLVAQPFIPPEALIGGTKLHEAALQNAGAGGAPHARLGLQNRYESLWITQDALDEVWIEGREVYTGNVLGKPTT